MAAPKSRIHFITGSDEAGVKKQAAELAKSLAPDADAFGLETIDGAFDTVDAAAGAITETIQSLLTLPFLGGTKLVWLKSASFLADTIAGKSELVVDGLEKLCKVLEAGLPEDVTFLLSAPQPDKRRSAYKTLVKLASTTVVDLPSLGFGGGEDQIIDWTATRVRAAGLRLSADAIETLAARIGLDSRQLDSELEKLSTAFGTATPVDADAVRELVPQTREGGIFDLSNAISKRDLPLALETLAQLFRQGEKGVGILLAAIVPTVRNLLCAKDLIARHKLPQPSHAKSFEGSLNRLSESALSHIPRKKDGTFSTYALGLAAVSSSHYALAELEAGFRACAEANQTLLSGNLTDEIIITRLLVGLLSRESKPTAR